MTWGSVIIGKVMVFRDVEVRSYIQFSIDHSATGKIELNLFQQIGCQHQDLRVWPKTLDCAQISHSFLEVFGRGHDFEDVERSPAHIVTEHFQIHKFEERRGLEVFAFRQHCFRVRGDWKANPYPGP